MGHLSTHVLDTAHGCPAAGMKVTLQRVDADGRAQLVRSITLNADGRNDGGPLLDAAAMAVGRWRLLFEVAPYFLSVRAIIDMARRRVRIDSRDVELTDQEFRLLHLLATHAGIVFSREALLTRIWRGDTYVTVRSVDTLVKRLRRRIEDDPAHPRFLLTVWGVGYKFADV